MCIASGRDRTMRDLPVPDNAVHFELFSSSFCGACRQTRMALGRVLQLVPGSTLTEFDVAGDPQRAESMNIEHTPTTIIRDSQGREVTRATGVPSLPQILVATAQARDTARARDTEGARP
jgi:hypothetical protein